MADLEPMGRELDDARWGTLIAVLASAHSKKDWAAADFIGRWTYQQPPPPPPTARELTQKINAVFGLLAQCRQPGK